MWVGVPREVYPGERRVAATPETVKKLKSMGFSVRVEAGAGQQARFRDSAYAEAGAELADAAAVWGADLVLKIRPPTLEEADRLGAGQTLISTLYPAQNRELLDRIAARGASALALEQIPRISRAQKMDVLSSQAGISGYRAVVEAAAAYGGYFAGQMSAAGKSRPAQVLIIGAGVAGLAAIGAARGLGAEVRAFDVRAASREQVESMGARFLTVELQEDGEAAGGYAKEMSPAFIAAEMALFAAQCREVDVVITTALIPGKRAPTLITAEMVRAMKPGSVIVDMAAEQGGNCELTKPGERAEEDGVILLGYTDLPSRLPGHASQFFGSNLTHLLTDMGSGEAFRVDFDDDVIYQAMVVHQGQVRFPVALRPPRDQKAPAPLKPAVSPDARTVETAAPAKPDVSAPVAAAPAQAPAKKKKGHGHGSSNKTRGGGVLGALTVLALAAAGIWAPPEFLQHFTVFVLACFIGWQVVWSVAPALHTPLMSVTNAISGIIVVGGMIAAGQAQFNAAVVLGAVAVLVATINISGGFLVTQRMLAMFRREE